MSRNLLRTDCYFCAGTVVLVKPPRLISTDDAKGYIDEFAGLIVAEAECCACLAEYMAWIDERGRTALDGRPFLRSPEDSAPFFDLSFRSTFNDEPGQRDKPKRVSEAEFIAAAARVSGWPEDFARSVYQCSQRPATAEDERAVADVLEDIAARTKGTKG